MSPWLPFLLLHHARIVSAHAGHHQPGLSLRQRQIDPGERPHDHPRWPSTSRASRTASSWLSRRPSFPRPRHDARVRHCPIEIRFLETSRGYRVGVLGELRRVNLAFMLSRRSARTRSSLRGSLDWASTRGRTASTSTIVGRGVRVLLFQVPLMVLIITPALNGLSPAWREAAENLGASDGATGDTSASRY